MAKSSWISGTRYGMLMLTGKSFMKENKPCNRRFVESICDCGKIIWSRWDTVSRGKCESCGCVHAIRLALNKPAVTHGLRKHPLYTVWTGMVSRCYSTKAEFYSKYGGRGVIICKEWRGSFISFYNWALANGWQKDLQLDKDIIYSKKHGTLTGMVYSPEYCSFVTRSQNCRTRSTSVQFEYKGVTKTSMDWCEEFKLSHSNFWCRIKRYKWSLEKTLTTPVR